MYKQDKKQVDEMMRILLWANDEIRNSIEKKQYEQALDLLEQCQDAAIQLGTFLEEIEGEGFVTVGHIEEFCEVIYQIHEVLTEKGFADAIVTSKTILKSLNKIENSINKDITVKKITVFLPYNASMWDSLESVWKAADADPDCDAYVIPIPFYDKNADGSFGKMHYEGDRFPDYVPITDYQTFDFGKNRPDMIYIHNPYDEYNRVTSVHPFFYSSKLKDLTDCLVYIPYFVLEEIKPTNKIAIKGMKHFCTLPGVANAHKVIVQSEDMRQIYIDVLSEWAGEETRKYWERKIYGTGSPKFDSVNSYKKENMIIPDDWKRIITKKDGSFKKIIFYNTGLVTMLDKKEQMIEKIKRTLDYFYTIQDDVALLWRPHPLYKETLVSMHPELWQQYSAIVEKYCTEGWGIYDDTSDLERAIVLSDAYYGDVSSVVNLYKKTGKTVMIQSIDVE